MAFPSGAVAHWKLDEALSTDNAIEVVNGYTGVRNNSPGVAAGKINGCRTFTYGSSHYFSVPDNADLSLGTGTYLTVAVWVWLNATAGYPCVLHKGGNSAATMEYNLLYDSGANAFRFECASGGTLLGTNWSSSSSTGAWHLIVADYENVSSSVSNVGICVDNGTRVVQGKSLGMGNDTGQAFEIGALSASALWWDGKLDSVTVWRRLLTNGELSDLWNGGAGLDYSAVAGAANTNRFFLVM